MFVDAPIPCCLTYLTKLGLGSSWVQSVPTCFVSGPAGVTLFHHHQFQLTQLFQLVVLY